MQITQEVIQQSLTVSAHTRQPLRHGILVAFDVACGRSDRNALGQLTNSILKNQLRRSKAGIGRSHTRRKPMPTVHTLQPRCPTLPAGPYEASLSPGQTRAITVSVLAIAGRQIHDGSSLIEFRSMKLLSDLLCKSLFCPWRGYRDTTRQGKPDLKRMHIVAAVVRFGSLVRRGAVR